MPDTLTDAQLAEIEARAKAATPGPWRYGGMIGDPGMPLRHFVEGDDEPICYSEPFAVDYAGGDKTFEFIANARADVPALVAALRASRERERRLSAAATELRRVAIGGATVDDRHQHGLLAAATGHQLYSYMTFADQLEAWIAVCEASDATEHAILGEQAHPDDTTE